MSSSAPRSPLRQLLESRISQISNEVENLFAEARERGRREFADQLNQAVRRIRQSADVEELGATLLDAACSFSTGAALFAVDAEVARGLRIRGVPDETAEVFQSLEIPLVAAAALAGAVEIRDPVTAVTAPREVSARLINLVGHGPDSRVSIFPVVARDEVPVLVYCWGAVEGSAIELLTQVGAAVWTELTRPAPPELVQIAPAAAASPVVPATATAPALPAAPAASAWDRLPPDEQRIHFLAQRFARVQVAEMRLHEPEAVQKGRARGDLYEMLRQQIDAARDGFRQAYFLACASMVDYLHLELVRTLANDNPGLPTGY